MMDNYLEGKTFTEQDYTTQDLPKGQYERCEFIRCNFSSIDLSGYKFQEVTFTSCDWSNVVLNMTLMQDVTMTDCKLIGIQFNEANAFGFSIIFERCTLDFSSFSEMVLSKVEMTDCRLNGVDFGYADLRKSTFTNCDFQSALFEGTNLEGLDMRDCVNYRVDPESNRVTRAHFAYPAVLGLLHKYNIKVD